MSKRVLFVPLIVLLVACQAARTPPQTAPASASAPSAMAEARPAPDSIRWVRESAEHVAALLQVYREAGVRVEAEAGARARGSWAVVLDADETVIDNSTYQLERAQQGLGYSSESWNAWVRRREATPLPGAKGFLDRVRALGGRIAIVTNRLQSECDDTAAVFTAHALPYDAMLCRPDGGPGDKNPRFEAVAAGRSPASSAPLDIVVFMGDNIQDFPGLSQSIRGQGDQAFDAFGRRFFLVPNPMYGSWQ
ncbi:MAG: 5'-nucleotidase, lipoprotein e(P4) family [Vicinamibacterales bacterium]